MFKFLMLAKNVGFTEAVRRLAGGALPGKAARVAPLPATGAELVLSEAHIHLLTLAAAVYHAHLLAYPLALDYLAGRGLDMDAIRRHRLRYTAGDHLRKYLRFKGWDEDLAAELKLIEERRGREHFCQRIVIPEWRDSKAVYLAGRALPKGPRAVGSFNPKYVFLDGAPKQLYGLETIRGQAEVFVTEGLFDWLMLIHWGYPAVCLLGTWLKKAHREHFDEARRIYLGFDTDKAGREAAEG